MSSTKDIVRFTTAGSVDDGKSTLIGRLLYDCQQIPQDQLEAVRQISVRKGHSEIDLSLFTDGLKDERAQGITIDVAILLRKNENSLLRIRRGTFSIREIWLRALRQQMQPSF